MKADGVLPSGGAHRDGGDGDDSASRSPSPSSFPPATFYDVTRTYEDNYVNGPFGAFADSGRASTAAAAPMPSAGAYSQPVSVDEASPNEASVATFPASSSSMTHLLGFPVRVPFGIPAGPLLNSRFTTAAFRHGFDVAVYKTVRSRAWPCNPFPNVLAVHPAAADGQLDPRGSEPDAGVLADRSYANPPSISNSFGVPSRDPDVWQPDMRDAIAAAGSGQLLVPSFQGSRTPDMDADDYVADHVRTARLVCETGARLMEMNTSCPNEGHNRLLCHDPRLVGRIAEDVKNEIGDRPLVVKLAWLPDDASLELMVRSTAARGLVQGFATINTISARLIDSRGRQALPGDGRERSGVCGDAIRDAGRDMVRRLAAIRERLGLDFVIVGVGGVVSAGDYLDYRQDGADAVMSATGAMADPELGHRVAAVAGVAHGGR